MENYRWYTGEKDGRKDWIIEYPSWKAGEEGKGMEAISKKVQKEKLR